MANKGIALASVGMGGLLFWSGLHGTGILATVKDVLAGTSPASAPNIHPVNTGSALVSGIPAPTGSISGIASDATQYQGDAYVWGASGPDKFDCSGLVNWVCGHDLHLSIPGFSNGQYSGHGPVTGQWYVWSGLTTVPANQMQAGDIVCWLTHMGIAVSSSEMISALDPALGVKVTTVQGASPGAEPMRIRRYVTLPTPTGAASIAQQYIGLG